MTTQSDRPADDPAVTPREVGDRRYRLGAAATQHGGEGLWSAHDRRLGRAVMVLLHDEPPHATPAALRLVSAPYPGLAPVLDAGRDRRLDGTWLGHTVFPASTWLPAAELPVSTGATGADLAAVAAWLVAASEHVRSVCGTTVALHIDHVVVDPRLPAGGLPPGECPVQWMPALGSTRPDELAGVVAHLGAGVERRVRRRFSAAVAACVVPQGRRSAARMLADIAGLDPRALRLPPLAPHHAVPGRRPFGRRPSAGNLPATKRRELTCVSAEASS